MGYPRLIDNWRKAHRFWSVRVAALSGTLQLAYAALPQRIHDDLPMWVTQWAAILMFAFIIVARLLKQDDKGA
jgi:hypothetical protein